LAPATPLEAGAVAAGGGTWVGEILAPGSETAAQTEGALAGATQGALQEGVAVQKARGKEAGTQHLEQARGPGAGGGGQQAEGGAQEGASGEALEPDVLGLDEGEGLEGGSLCRTAPGLAVAGLAVAVNPAPNPPGDPPAVRVPGWGWAPPAGSCPPAA
jgi:hypothetical protein